MSDQGHRRTAEARGSSRLKLPAMYTLVRAKARGGSRFTWTGHIYDLSTTGMRFELDQALDPGTEIEVRAMLPGSIHTTFRATGRVVRIHDDEWIGPTRMAMIFDHFSHSVDRQRLADYLLGCGIRQAA
jgi:c-di-GMP-binding flagellar brake protein YcgR